MGWAQKLLETYDNCSSEIGKYGSSQPLCPIYHTIINSQTEVTIDINGEFISATQNKQGTPIIVPCTAKSLARTSDSTPHPLCDALKYMDAAHNKHKYYTDQLKDWTQSPYSTPHIQAIYQYISKNKILEDLTAEKIDININYVVRFQVFGGGIHTSVWNNPEIFEKWIQYYNGVLSREGHKNICYITGENTIISNNHPKRLVPYKGNAKIISADDGTHEHNYDGLYNKDSKNAQTVGFVASQKIHHALSWLVDRQGYSFNAGDTLLTILNWSTNTSDLPNYITDAATGDFMEMPASTSQEYAIKVKKALAGYQQSIPTRDNIMVIMLNSLTPGRLSVSYFQEFSKTEYFQRMEQWYNDTCWQLNYYKDGQLKKHIGTPLLKSIAEFTYGNYKDERLILNDKLKQATITKLTRCVVEGKPIPPEIVNTLVTKTCQNRLTMGKNNAIEWENALGTACAVYRNYMINYMKEDIAMAYDHARTTRDYLYGALWAIIDVGEEITYKKKDRQTNAARMMVGFKNNPYHNWSRLLPLLEQAYFSKLPPKKYQYIQTELNNTMSKFCHEDFISTKSLSGEFLLGYYSKREEIRNKIEIIEEEAQNE